MAFSADTSMGHELSLSPTSSDAYLQLFMQHLDKVTDCEELKGRLAAEFIALPLTSLGTVEKFLQDVVIPAVAKSRTDVVNPLLSAARDKAVSDSLAVASARIKALDSSFAGNGIADIEAKILELEAAAATRTLRPSSPSSSKLKTGRKKRR